MNIRRREFLRSGIFAGGAGLAFTHPYLMHRQLLAQENSGNDKRLIFIFQRGRQ